RGTGRGVEARPEDANEEVGEVFPPPTALKEAGQRPKCQHPFSSARARALSLRRCSPQPPRRRCLPAYCSISRRSPFASPVSAGEERQPSPRPSAEQSSLR